MERIILKEARDSGKKWQDKPIYSVLLTDGRAGSCFDEKILSLPIGQEVELDVKEGKPYNGKPQYIFNLPKDKKGGFAPKDYTFEKKRVALECAVALIASGKVDVKYLTETRDKFFEYLK